MQCDAHLLIHDDLYGYWSLPAVVRRGSGGRPPSCRVTANLNGMRVFSEIGATNLRKHIQAPSPGQTFAGRASHSELQVGASARTPFNFQLQVVISSVVALNWHFFKGS